jgi:hypothetical protein
MSDLKALKYESLSGALKSIVPQGIKTRWRRHKMKRQQISRFVDNLRKTDAFLIGHPKSGNTWTAYMLAIVANRDFDSIVRMSNIGEYVPTIHSRDFLIDSFEHLPSPRIFRNEGPQFADLYPRTVYLVRDPRSVLLSYYHHCVHDTGDNEWPISAFVDEMLTYGCIQRLEPYLIRWDIQVQNWLARAGTQPVLVVKYEDLKRDQRGMLARMAEFLGLPAADNLIDLAVQRTSFASMRKEEEIHGSESFAGEKGSKGFFVRKGKVDSWREEMPAETIRKIEDRFGRVMERVGYTI